MRTRCSAFLLSKARPAIAAAGVAALLALAPGAGAAFPGGNGRIAFQSDRDGNPEIYVMNADGTGQTNVTSSPGSDEGPAWSPDGTRIAFASNRDGNAEIYVMNADGAGQTNLTAAGVHGDEPAWSPDGRLLAFEAAPNGNFEIYIERRAAGRRIGGACRRATRRNARRRRCVRWTRVTRLTQRGRTGANSMPFSGRYAGTKALAPGRYRVSGRAEDAAGNPSRVKRAAFEVVRR